MLVCFNENFYDINMERFLRFCILFLIFIQAPYQLVAAPVQSKYIKPDTYNYMYPYMNNQMRTDLNPGVTPNQSTNPMDVVVRTEKLSAPRRVVPRKSKTTGRSAKPITSTNNNVVRSATGGTVQMRSNNARAATNTQNRRVVARSGVRRSAPQIRSGVRTDNGRTSPQIATPGTLATERMSSVQCMAGYTECMDMYCEREQTDYNRCYCSAKLSQIDSTYKSAIDSLITQILTIKNTNNWSDSEMDEYWMATVGKYSNSNSWTNIDNALNINWADTESRVRGQNAFVTGHDYCVQYLRGCSYMATNLRDAYRSQINRDCATYEQSLGRLKNVAESIVEMYK